ncbi:hypothetical protein, conserved [Eimeria praecox]|uniref:Kelch motif domain-containing protein n=1 Tax=Eimeria praecox TaxID=51316 RepID=U6GSF9_9EIME|nr:hypothetical protein, conserved [Eimeria praecox]
MNMGGSSSEEGAGGVCSPAVFLSKDSAGVLESANPLEGAADAAFVTRGKEACVGGHNQGEGGKPSPPPLHLHSSREYNRKVQHSQTERAAAQPPLEGGSGGGSNSSNGSGIKSSNSNGKDGRSSKDSNGSGNISKSCNSSNNGSNDGNTEVHWARSLVRPVLVGGCCAAAAAAAAAAAPYEALHRVIERTSEVVGDAFFGFTAAEAAASLRQTPFPLLQEAAAAALVRRQQQHSLLSRMSSPQLAASMEKREIIATATTGVLDRDWLESYIDLLCTAGSSCWLWWRLQLDAAPGGPGVDAAAATPSGVVTPEQRVHHAAASVSAERQCSAVAVFGGRNASGALADNEVYLLEVTPLLALDLPLYILGDLLSLALSESAREATTAAAAPASANEAEVGAALSTAVSPNAGTPMASPCAYRASPQLARRIYSSRSNNNSNPPLLRWRVPLCVGQKPSPRLGHSLVYAEPHLILYGGKDEGGRLLSDVWLLDIFDWRRVAGPDTEAATGTASGNLDPPSVSGEAGAKAAASRQVALSWVSLDFSSSPLKPPGRFLHSCSVFFTSTNDGACSIVCLGDASAAVLRAAAAAGHYGDWRRLDFCDASTHSSLCSSQKFKGALEACPSLWQPQRKQVSSQYELRTPQIDDLCMVASVCAGSSLLLLGGLQIRLGAAPVFVVLDPELLPTSSAEPLLATRYHTQLQLRLRAGAAAAARTQHVLFRGSGDAAAAGDTDSIWAVNSGSSSSVELRSMEQLRQETDASYGSNSGAHPRQTVPIDSASGGLPLESTVATAARGAARAAAFSGGIATVNSSRERSPVDASSLCSVSKRPCSRPWSFDSSSLSKQEPASETIVGEAAAAASSGVALRAAKDIGDACVPASSGQVQGQGENQEGSEGGMAARGAYYPSEGSTAAYTRAAEAAVLAASSEMCHPSDAAACTPRRFRRMAALQALESFKQLPDTLGAASGGVSGQASTDPAPASVPKGI